MPVLLPVQDSPYFSQLVDLEDTTFSLVVRWNTREEAWYFDIKEQDGTTIISGQKLMPSVDLTTRWADARMPAGIIVTVAVVPTNTDDRPTRQSLVDGSLQLWYYTEAEVLEIASTV